MRKIRLDLLLMERGLVESRAKAQALIMAGQVRVDGQVELIASKTIFPGTSLELLTGPRFVSRGGEKLEAALLNFRVNVTGRVCADVGSSTGGFTDCLLQHGAVKVFAIDVGKGILHWKLRTDRRLVVMEGTNARFLTELPEKITLVTIDTSFISLKILLPVVRGWFRSLTTTPNTGGKAEVTEPGEMGMETENHVLALIKPQFEAGRIETARNKGVIRNPEVHKLVLMDILTFAQDHGFSVRGLMRSPLLGPKGNVEFFAWLAVDDAQRIDIPVAVQKVLAG
jgi:23S rRNA (cytidine1920-2'-O)/16S rRNA (cytidine1409-2'-O)-methyltransferase